MSKQQEVRVGSQTLRSSLLFTSFIIASYSLITYLIEASYPYTRIAADVIALKMHE